MLNTLLPQRADNTYRGQKLALRQGSCVRIGKH
jgi:hypothetical protein